MSDETAAAFEDRFDGRGAQPNGAWWQRRAEWLAAQLSAAQARIEELEGMEKYAKLTVTAADDRVEQAEAQISELMQENKSLRDAVDYACSGCIEAQKAKEAAEAREQALRQGIAQLVKVGGIGTRALIHDYCEGRRFHDNPSWVKVSDLSALLASSAPAPKPDAGVAEGIAALLAFKPGTDQPTADDIVAAPVQAVACPECLSKGLVCRHPPLAAPASQEEK